MKATERNDIIRAYFEEDMALLMAKGHDYAGNSDCLANLKRFGYLGIVVRLSDKFSRLETLAKSSGKMAVPSESLIDTLRDIRNYSFLAQIFLEGKDKDPATPLFEDPGAALTKEASDMRAEATELLTRHVTRRLGQLDPGAFRPKGYLNEDEAREFIKEIDT